jgi:hypothetical protein
MNAVPTLLGVLGEMRMMEPQTEGQDPTKQYERFSEEVDVNWIAWAWKR